MARMIPTPPARCDRPARSEFDFFKAQRHPPIRAATASCGRSQSGEFVIRKPKLDDLDDTGWPQQAWHT